MVAALGEQVARGQTDPVPPDSWARRQEIAQLGEITPNVAADFDPLLGTPTFIRSTTAFLTRRSGRTATQVIADFVNDNPATFGVSLSGGNFIAVGEFPNATYRTLRDFLTPSLGPTGVRHLTYQQTHSGQDIYGCILTANVTGDGMLVNIGSRFVTEPASPLSPPACDEANRTVRDVVAAACDEVQDGRIADIVNLIAPEDVCEWDWKEGHAFQGVGDTALWVRSVLHPASATELVQAWVVRLPSNPEQEDAAWECIIRHSDLSTIDHYDRTMRFCEPTCPPAPGSTDVCYRVYTDDSPVPGTPGLVTLESGDSECVMRTKLTQIDDCGSPINDTRSLVTVSLDDIDEWSPVGWINDGHFLHCARNGATPSEVPETVLCGNNVVVVATRVPSDPVILGSGPRVFDFVDPNSLSAVATQAFVVANEWHDRMYAFGFNEVAGNCQAENFGRGGAAADPLVVTVNEDGNNYGNVPAITGEYQDGARMTVRLFTWGGRYSGVDRTVAFHELSHVLSTRLHVGTVFEGAGGLAGGLFEGWSDYLALALTHKSTDSVDESYPVFSWTGRTTSGVYLNHYYFGGTHWYPYTSNMASRPVSGIASNPLTYGHADQGPTGGSPPLALPSTDEHWRNPAVRDDAPRLAHRTGEIWASLLVQCRASLAADLSLGYDGANALMLQLVVDGMKLDPGAPSFIQARDAILQADLLRNGGVDQHLLWQGFSERKLGWYATEPISRGRARDLQQDGRMPPSSAISIFFPDGVPYTIATCESTFVEAFVVSPSSPIEAVLADATPNGQAIGLPSAPIQVGPGRYRAELLPAPCRQSWAFHIMGVNEAGQSQKSGDRVFAGVEAVIFEDDMEGTDSQRGPELLWAPSPVPSIPPAPTVAGQVERVDPNGGAVQPSKDATPGPGSLCWVTEDRRDFGTNSPVDDVDLAVPGASLESPVLPDVTANTTLLVEYSLWYVSNLGDINDVECVVEFLRGSVVVPATPPADLRPAESAQRWQRKRATFNTGETSGADCKLRFRMIDPPPDSTVEIGIDDVRVSLITHCEACCDADMNADGNIDQDDIAYLIGVVGGDPNPSGVDPDFNHDGNVDQDDVADLVSYVGGAGCP